MATVLDLGVPEQEWTAPWVNQFQHSDDDAKELIGRLAGEPVQYIDCLVTPSGSAVLGVVKCHKLSADVYRVIYVTRFPSGGVHLGEGEALFAGEPQKFEQKYGSAGGFTAWEHADDS